jgi:hypothetical protein
MSAAFAPLGFAIDNVPPLTIAARGCIALFDVNAHQEVCMDPRSGAEARAGRDGEGPGEFRSVLSEIALDDGRIIALSENRLTILSPTWKIASTVRLEHGLGQLISASGDTVYGLGIGFDSVYAVSLTDGGGVAKFGQRTEDAAIFRGPQPYQRGLWIVPRRGNGWYVVPAWNYTILREDRRGTVQDRIVRDVKPEFPSPSELQEMKRTMAQANPGANLAPFLDRAAKSAKPYIVTAPVEDASGRLWVMTGRIRNDSNEIDVFGPTGKFLESVRIPGAVRKAAMLHGDLVVVVKELSGIDAGDIDVRRYHIDH